jgi:hypothetical protein
VHHWPDRAQGLGELRRVARDRVVIFTWVPVPDAAFWLVEEYFPELAVLDRGLFPTPEEMQSILGPIEVRPLPVPHDCTDGFLGAYWRRPHAYLDPAVRRAISTFSRLPDAEPGLARLRRDLQDGTWTGRHGALLTRSELDLGYRLVISRPSLPSGERAG